MLHSFEPTQYYNTIGSHPPALVVRDGDIVETSTVDARGWDKSGEQAAPAGNPMTGPFYVEGAAPGDTLEVRLLSIEPNRPWGWTRNVLASNVVDPDSVRDLPPGEIVRWSVDPDGIRLEERSGRLAGLTIAPRPFLGCFGVAPHGGQAISTATSGPYGGNMDYNAFTAGTIVHFPVFAEGALFHLGDGHACQGDGEIVGTGVEISMNVRFSLHVHKGRKIGWPRGETAAHWLCVGNARPLDQALQHATTEMLALLQADFGMTAIEASLLLGQAVEYDIANVFNPAYSVACKIPKIYCT